MPLRLVLMGTGEFALPAFTALVDSSHDVVGVFTQPERSGRGHHHHRNPIQELADAHGIPVFRPHTVNDAEPLQQLRDLYADVFVVAAYGQILSKELLSIPRIAAINLHGSLLPRHRGAAPVQYAIWKGDVLTGVTIFAIQQKLDSGRILGRVTTAIGEQEMSGELMARLAELAVPLTLEVIADLERHGVTGDVQDASLVTKAPRIKKTDGLVDWTQTSRAINCQVRAMHPWPKASSFLMAPDGSSVRLIILQTSSGDIDDADEAVARLSESTGSALGSHGRLFVRSGSGVIELLRVQPEGKKPMDASEFLNGHDVVQGSRFVASSAGD